MRVMVCWAGISGYMGACWRALSATTGVQLRVLAMAPKANDVAPFDPAVLAGVDCLLLDEKQRQDESLLRGEVDRFAPDLLVISGWFHEPYNRMVRQYAGEIPMVMTSDLPWDGSLRRRLGTLALRHHVNRFDAVWVTGERATQYMRRMGVPIDRIFTGLYGVDVSGIEPAGERRRAGEWPGRFLFCGRYAEGKGLDLLIEAYKAYRARRADAWELVCCGRGGLASLLSGVTGVRDMGFVQPQEMPAVWATAGAFVLPSRADPWPLVVAEACAAGLPLILSTAAGNSVELLRHLDNGFRVSPDVRSLAMALQWMHDHHAELAWRGELSRKLVSPYSADAWARRLVALAAHVMSNRPMV